MRKNQEKAESKFIGILKEDAIIDEENIRLFIDQIEAVDDKSDIEGLLKSFGLIINIEKDQIAEEDSLEDYLEGQKVTFVIKGIPAMTASIPPHLAGQALKEIKISKD